MNIYTDATKELNRREIGVFEKYMEESNQKRQDLGGNLVVSVSRG